MKRYKEYKGSGIAWVGEMPNHWIVSRLKILAKICGGQDQKDVIDDNGIYPIFGSGGEFGKTNRYLHSGPSVLLGRKGTIDKPRYVSGPFWTVDTAFFTDIAIHTNPRLFFYLCTTIDFEIYKYGSAIPSMSRETLNNIAFPIAPIEEQTQIAQYLDYKTAQIDKLIMDKEKLIELLNEERTAIINQAVTRGLNPDVLTKDSGVESLGMVPSHWGVKKLKHLCVKIGSGVTPRGGAEVYKDFGVPLLRSQNIYFEGFKLEDVAFISEEIHNSMSNSTVFPNDVLINITGGSIGRCFYVSNEFQEANVNQHVCILRPNEKITTLFLYNLMRSDVVQSQIEKCQIGGNREALNFEQLKNFILPLPSIAEQKAILKNINIEQYRVALAIKNTSQEIQLLKEYKTALISEVVTGKVDVREEVVENAKPLSVSL
jgi:type I restriction enzyme S subunit